jgi:TonB family protein
MTAIWIGYCLLVSALLGLAALLAERALGHYRKPVRAVWAAAVVGSLLLPLAAYLAPSILGSLSTPIPAELLTLEVLRGAPVDAIAGETGGFDLLGLLPSSSALLLGVWVGAILLLTGYLAYAYGRLRGEMRSWAPGRILDAPVLVSHDRGPAVVGLRRSVIVLPRWIAELEENVLRLIFLHEREHQVAGDQRLFAIGILGVLAMPWNPVMWWQLRRLRLAIEFDCDHRVIANGVTRREYAEALLEVGSRVSRPPLAAAAFAENRSAVERRLRRLTAPLGQLRALRAGVAAAVAAVLLGIACESPVPSSARSAADEAPMTDALRADAVPPVDTGAYESQDPSESPSFIPFDTPPRLENSSTVVEALREEYPKALRDAGVGGRVEIWLFIGKDGSVLKNQVKTSSDEPALDTAARLVADRMTFQPAEYEGQPTTVWVSQWISFETERSISAAEADASPPSEEADASSEADATDADAPRRILISTDEGTLVLPPLPPGSESINSGLEPLIVIDGVILAPGTPMPDLDPDDIESVEVIKGDAAARLYGDRGANGVIQITTKEGGPS